jgi:hypothetical protein
VTDLRKAVKIIKPVYAQAKREVPNSDVVYHVWHKVAAFQPSKAPETTLSDCGLRFAPEALLYRERTLINWAEDDDVCECAAVMPTEDQCREAGTQLLIGTKE